MTVSRRKKIEKIYDAIEKSLENLELLKDEEEDYRDNLQYGSDRYDKSVSAVKSLKDSLLSLDEALTRIEEVLE